MDESAPSEAVHLICAYLLTFLPIVFMAFEVLLTYVVCIHKDYRTNTTYIIIVAISVAEFIGNVGHLYTGLCLFIDETGMVEFSKYIGSLTFSFFTASICLYLILGLNRLDVFKPPWLHFSLTNKFIYGFLICTGILNVAMIALSLSPWLSLVFNRDRIVWKFQGPFTSLVLKCLFWTNSTMLVVTLMCYVIIFCTIVIRRKSKINGNQVKTAEIKLLIGATIQFLSVLLGNVLFYFDAVIPYLLIYMVLLGTSGVKSFIHICVNTKLRRRCLKVLHCSSPKVHTNLASSVGLPIMPKNQLLGNVQTPNRISF